MITGNKSISLTVDITVTCPHWTFALLSILPLLISALLSILPLLTSALLSIPPPSLPLPPLPVTAAVQHGHSATQCQAEQDGQQDVVTE